MQPCCYAMHNTTAPQHPALLLGLGVLYKKSISECTGACLDGRALMRVSTSGGLPLLQGGCTMPQLSHSRLSHALLYHDLPMRSPTGHFLISSVCALSQRPEACVT